MSNERETAGKTAKRYRRITSEGNLIHRPTRYPFEVPCADGWIIQTRCFTDEALTIGETHICSYFVGDIKTGKETCDASSAYQFDTCEEAIDYILKNGKLAEGEDGNIYPRVLKVRISCIVEGVAFEAAVRDIKGGAKIEGVA